MVRFPNNHWLRSLSFGAICAATIYGVTTTLVTPAQQDPNNPGYLLRVLAINPGLAPGPEGGEFTNDFEPDSLNNQGEAAFVSDLTLPINGGEGVFLTGKDGTITQIMRAGEPAPGGGTFDFLELGLVHLNDERDLSLAFTLSPLSLNPVGANSGLYRYSHITKTLTAIVVPYVTPAPGGGAFAGVYFDTSMNNLGDIVFSGIIPDSGPSPPDESALGLGAFRTDENGVIRAVAKPGDAAPGGGTFDVAGSVQGVSINDGGDVVFSGHVAGDLCLSTFCLVGQRGLYLQSGATGEIRRIVNYGVAAPGGGVLYDVGEPFLNNRDEVLFGASLTLPSLENPVTAAYFLYSKGRVLSVARPGDAMPGGGHILSLSAQPPNHYLNNRGEMGFSATLDTDDNQDGVPDTGLYVRSGGVVSLVARTGTVIPDVGTIANLAPPVAIPNSFLANSSSAILNDRGQVFFQATLEDGRGVLLLAMPRSEEE
jgi:hypothetical protein